MSGLGLGVRGLIAPGSMLPFYLGGGSIVSWFEPNDVTNVAGKTDIWSTKVGLGNATANSAGKRPTWSAESAGVGAFLTFDGAQTGVGNTALDQDTILIPGACTMLFRFKLAAVPTSGGVNSLSDMTQSATKTFFRVLMITLGGYQQITFSAKIGAIASNGVGFSPTLDANWHSLIITYNNGTNTAPGSYQAWYDGAPKALAASSGLVEAVTNIGNIGALMTSAHAVSQVMNGNIKRRILYNTVLNAADIGRLIAWDAAQL
jgi:hypothetical protein